MRKRLDTWASGVRDSMHAMGGGTVQADLGRREAIERASTSPIGRYSSGSMMEAPAAAVDLNTQVLLLPVGLAMGSPSATQRIFPAKRIRSVSR